MPELPEVETVCRGLNEIIQPNKHHIAEVKLQGVGLREPFRKKELRRAKGQRIINIFRRAKYLIFELEKNYLISHLGMTGSWRIQRDIQKHDHIKLILEDGRILTFRDPRRFGQFDIIEKINLNEDRRFMHLGPDPILDDEFNGEYLFKKSRNRQTPIKNFIMNQEVVVGVGNIYASEALFLAGIKPQRLAKKITFKESLRLVEAIKETLLDAILCGGSTISDFKQAGGSEGYFQNLFYVYDKEEEPCHYCQGSIKKTVLGGRSSFFCSQCQK